MQSKMLKTKKLHKLNKLPTEEYLGHTVGITLNHYSSINSIKKKFSPLSISYNQSLTPKLVIFSNSKNTR
jgi:hypothetical protein